MIFKFLPTLVVLLNCIFIFKTKAEKHGVSSCIARLWEPFRGSEIVSKFTKGPKNRPEAIRGALRY